MKVLNLHRPSGLTGGDIGLALEFSKALSEAGVESYTRPADQLDDLDTFDFVYLWAACSPDWGYPASLAVKNSSARLITVPIWWNRDARLAHFGQTGQDVVPGYTPAVAATLEMADVWAVNTMSEAVECWKLVPRHPAFLLSRGFNGVAIAPSPEPDDYVICIARVEKHKNQRSLAKACEVLDRQLLLVGPVADDAYAYECQRVGSTTHILGEVSHEMAMTLLADARVYALPSFSECISVANCEACYLGVPSVLSIIGCEPEYFGTGPTYCDPSSCESIVMALSIAWEQPRGKWAYMPTWAMIAQRGIKLMEAMS